MRWFLLVVGCILAAFALAQTKDDENRKKAKEAFEKGERYYQLADYNKALEHYKESYAISGEALLIYNIGQCYRYLNRNQEALDAYQLFLKQEPTPLSRKYRPNAEGFVKELTELIAKEKGAQSPPASQPSVMPESQPSKPPEIVTSPETKPTPATQALVLPSSQEAPTPQGKTPNYRLPLALGGAALIPGGIALGLGVQLSRLEEPSAEGGVNGPEQQQKVRLAKGVALSSDVLLLSAAVWGGLTYLKKRQAAEESKP